MSNNLKFNPATGNLLRSGDGNLRTCCCGSNCCVTPDFSGLYCSDNFPDTWGITVAGTSACAGHTLAGLGTYCMGVSIGLFQWTTALEPIIIDGANSGPVFSITPTEFVLQIANASSAVIVFRGSISRSNLICCIPSSLAFANIFAAGDCGNIDVATGLTIGGSGGTAVVTKCC